MNKEKFLAAIIEEINDMDSDGLINLNNRYCEEVNYYDDMIYENGQDFFETHFSNDIMEAVRAASYGEYDYSDNYVKFNGYGNLESLDYITTDDLGNIVDEIAKEVADNFSTYTDLFSISEDDFEDEEEEEEDEEEEETEEIN
jgi:hypothetical protein